MAGCGLRTIIRDQCGKAVLLDEVMQPVLVGDFEALRNEHGLYQARGANCPRLRGHVRMPVTILTALQHGHAREAHGCCQSLAGRKLPNVGLKNHLANGQ